MSWRTVVISKRSKLDLKMNYLVVRDVSETRRVFLDEIAILMIENPAISITGNLMEALVKRKIKVVFCDSKRNPYSELMPYYGSYDTSRKIRQQIQWSEEIKALIWQRIIIEKIGNQARLLELKGKDRESAMLKEYSHNVELADITNREGHSAKVYFNALFGMDFKRDEVSPINAALDYGYSILLSAFNREAVSNGYITQIGIHHSNVHNYFNLSSDLMEPFRPLVDELVSNMELKAFGSEEKYALVNVLNMQVEIANSKQSVLNAIKIYCKSVTDSLSDGDVGVIRFFEY